MNEGVFNILRALGHGRVASRTEVIRVSGEAHSAVTALSSKEKPKWFVEAGEQFQLSDKGLAALARELTARHPALEEDELVQALKPHAAERPRVKRELDQVLATLPSVARRARRLVEAGEAQRGLAFFGDDDLASLAVALLLRAAGDARKVHVLDIDQELVDFLAEREELGVEVIHHDLREPLPRKWLGRFGAVFTDPPYAPQGFALFTSRGAQALKSDGRLYVQMGWSRRARERGLAKQRLLSEVGFLIEEMIPDETEYDGAESIGARSSLMICAMTPQTRALGEDRLTGDLYTRDQRE